MRDSSNVTPAKAENFLQKIPAFAGMTLLILFLTFPVRAQSISDVNKNLKEVEQNLTESQGGAAKLDKTIQTTRIDLKRIESDTQKLSSKVKNTENQSIQLREKLDMLEARKQELDISMKRLKAVITPMIQAALDMASTPTDLNLFLEDPAKANRILNAHVALSGAASSTQAYLDQYAQDKVELEALEKDIVEQQEKLDGTLEDLKDNREELARVMAEKARIAKEAEGKLAQTKGDIKILQQKRESLANLLSSLKREEAERKAAEERRKRQKAVAARHKGKAVEEKTPVPSRRTLARGLPASGYVVRRFGEADPESGLESQGIRIEGEPNGLVTSPVSGEVRYAGEFRGLGKLVIIEDSGGDFSLLGNLGHITAREGAKLGKGSPVGTLSPSTSPAPQLYYELRKDGKSPVDPMSLF